ncbi:MAG: class I SAM-dependent methyltransferase [Bizionia paragorgiae]|jgi:hypothetical protein|uniref:class I SAM-dependent methyltransferase n=1 Tax=Bizionia paragorgiae TaxID=283786 RepID=UPI003C5F9F14
MKQEEKNREKNKTPWPTKKAMEQVYDMNLWGTNGSPFYSGEGSHSSELVNPYVEVVTTFLKSFEKPLTVCDLGCGDFNVGKALIGFTKRYVAVDIVPDLVAHNSRQFKADNLEFHCLDIAVDDLPSGDCALVRQVLQHLSNAEVQQVLVKLKAFKYVVLTEHIPEGDFIPNKDIISGQGIRIKKQSGLEVLAAPFSLKPQAVQQLLTVQLKKGKGRVVTNLYTMF